MRSHDVRLRKLEARMPQTPDLTPKLFIFGRDLDDATARAEAEKQAGRVSEDQYAYPVVWRGADSIPAPKWTTKTDHVTDEAMQDWIATVCTQVGIEPRPEATRRRGRTS